jgi:hypothetical protein
MTVSEATIEQNEPINLMWSQELAASWSIMWPCWVVSLFFVAVIPGLVLNITLLQHLVKDRAVLALSANLIVVVGHGVFSFRLVRKNYRSFWIGVLHEGEPLKRGFSFLEQARVSLQILWLHVAYLVPASFFFMWITDRVPVETVQSLNSLGQLVRILVVGPAAIRWAIYANYSGFRLQAYRRKRKIDPRWSSLRNLESEDDVRQ